MRLHEKLHAFSDNFEQLRDPRYQKEKSSA
jgi:hypothetical protein